MIRRLLKDLRVLAPVGLLGALAAVVAVHWVGPPALGILALVAVASSVQVFGHEYTHRRMDWLLAQPLTRRRLWVQKTAALGVFLVLFLSLTAAMGMLSEVVQPRPFKCWGFVSITHYGISVPSPIDELSPTAMSLQEYRKVAHAVQGRVLGDVTVFATSLACALLSEPISVDLKATGGVFTPRVFRHALLAPCWRLLPFVLLLVGASCGGLWMGLWLRQTHTAFWAALVAAAGAVLLWSVLAPNPSAESLQGYPLYLFGVPSLIWGVCALVGSLIHIQRLEV